MTAIKPRPRRILTALLLIVAAGVTLPPLAVEVFYRSALRALPPAPPPPESGVLPPLAETAFWLEGADTWPASPSPMSAWRLSWRLLIDVARDAKSAGLLHGGERMASAAARAWTRDHPLPRQRSYWAATVWMSRNRDPMELTRVAMTWAAYGRGATDFDAATAAYFGKPTGDLAPHEVALLVARTRSPNHLDVDCHPDRAVAARNRLLGRLFEAGALTRADHDSAVAAPLGVIPRTCKTPDREPDQATPP